jgi:uncharacterized Zn finger protein
MVDSSNPNYVETLIYIGELTSVIEKINKNVNQQIPYGVTKNYNKTRDEFLNWVEEIEFHLIEYSSRK